MVPEMPGSESGLPPEIDTSRPHPARIYDYFLGGKNHFAATGRWRRRSWAAMPTGRTAARENRAFLGRAVRYLAAEAGIRQFLDIGTGLPTTDNVHEVAQRVAPASRIVYVDNDPLVLAHARALLTSAPEGRTAYIHADLRDPAGILANPVTREVLDFTPAGRADAGRRPALRPGRGQPGRDHRDAARCAAAGQLPRRVACHGGARPGREGGRRARLPAAGIPAQPRDSGEFARLAFNGLELVPPGVVLVSEWRPDGDRAAAAPAEVSFYGGVARKEVIKAVSPRDGREVHDSVGISDN